jgi:hypothetical protein
MRVRRVSTMGLAIIGLATGSLASSSSASAAAPEKPLTRRAAEVTGVAATLHGVLNPKVSATTGYHFIYGSEGSCEGTTTEPGAEATGKAIKVSTPITGLIPHTKYTFCVVATNATSEETSGSPLTFETLPVTPLITEESASAIAQTTASVSALINPELQQTTCKPFQYVDEASFLASEYSGASEVPCEPEELEPGSESTPTSANLTGLAANTTYHFRALAENGSGLTTGPDRTFLTLPNLPTAITGEPSSITPNSATISGSVNPGSVGPNSDTTYLFQYGHTTSYGAQTPVHDAGQGTTSVPETASLSALEAGAGYHYRIVATNDNENTPQTAFGKDETFATVPTPPILSAVSVLNVTQSTAMIAATLDPRGLPTRYELKLGAAPGPLQAQAFGNIAGGGVVALTLNLGSLSPGTLYSYSLIATNLSGTAEPPPEGAFTTAAGTGASSPLVQPPTPPLLATPTTVFPRESPTSGGVLGARSKALTKAQRLANALKACRKKPKNSRKGCELKARRRYGPRHKKGKQHQR